jgi:hypothetical protein
LFDQRIRGQVRGRERLSSSTAAEARTVYLQIFHYALDVVARLCKRDEMCLDETRLASLV